MNVFLYFLPELVILLSVFGVLVSEMSYHGERTRLITPIALVGLAAAEVQSLLAYSRGPAVVLDGTFTADGLTLFFRTLFIISAFLIVLTARASKEISEKSSSEFVVFVLSTTLGACIAAGATDLLLLSVSVLSVSTIAQLAVGYTRGSRWSAEASLKAMAFAVLSFGFFWVAATALYLRTGSLGLHEIRENLLVSPAASSFGLTLVGLLFCSLAFQIGGFPFGIWYPDAIQGAPTAAALLLTTTVRMTGFAVLLRFATTLVGVANSQGPFFGPSWSQLVGVVSSITMLAGAFLALRQTSAKRLMAALTLLGSGVLLTGLISLKPESVGAMLYGLVADLVALAGAFTVVSRLKDKAGSDDFNSLRDAASSNIPESVALIVFLSSLLAIPPMPGFIARFALLSSAVNEGWYTVMTIALVASVLAVVSFARFTFSLVSGLGAAFLQPKTEVQQNDRWFVVSLLLPLGILTLLAEWFLRWGMYSFKNLIW